MKKILLITALFLLATTSGKAQSNLLITVDSSFFTMNDTFNLGASSSFNIYVRNFGPDIFNDTTGGASPTDSLSIYTAVRDVSFFDTLNITNIYQALGPPTIPVGDSLAIPMTWSFNESPAGYHEDINVIVIWPYAGMAPVIDSLEFEIFLVDPDGIGEIDINSLIKVFPNPVMDHFRIENSSPLAVEEVRITDASGKEMGALKNPSCIETRLWPAGMYMVTILFENKQHKTIRILKQK